LRGLLFAAAAGAAVALAAVAAFAWGPNPASAAATATCTYEQREAAAARLRVADRRAASERAAYFRRHKSRKQRAAFVRKQRKQLSALRAAAACTVPPLPPSSSDSCSFMLAPNPADVWANSLGWMILNEGPLVRGLFTPSLGPVRGIILMVAFADYAPPTGSAAASAQIYVPDTKYFEETSYGRFSLSIESVDRWLQLPDPAATYFDGAYDFRLKLFSHAVAAADPYVDFSRYQFAIVVPTSRFPGGLNNGWAKMPGYGARSAEGEIRLGALLTADISRFGPGAARVVNHEFMHSMGLPDLYYDDGSTRGWDPMSSMPGLPAIPRVHLLGWHKWRLRWLDPTQLTCLSSPGMREETLTAIARQGGKKLVVVPMSASSAYVVEARTKTGYDATICEEGVLVYDVDSRIAQAERRAGRGVIAIKGTRRCFDGGAGALHTGESFEDAAIKVEVLARDAGAFRVRVTRK
jgi:M6 family metalloprotease-like protein